MQKQNTNTFKLVKDELKKILTGYDRKETIQRRFALWIVSKIDRIFSRGETELNFKRLKRYKHYEQKILQRYGHFKYTFYCCWDNRLERWEENPDFSLCFIGHDRGTNLERKEDPDRALAIKITNQILKALTPIAETWDKTRCQIYVVQPKKLIIDIYDN